MSEPLIRRVEVRCALSHAFDVFTRRIDMWWPRSHRKDERSIIALEARAGGRFYERAATGEEKLLGEVLRWEPPHRLTYSWWPGANDKPTEVDVQFRAEGERTIVEVTHAEGRAELGADWPKRVEKFTWGWGVVLPAFVQYAQQAGDSET